MKYFTIHLTYILLVLGSQQIYSQEPLMIHQGEIEYEKRLNSYAILKKYYNDKESKDFVDTYKKNNGQFKITKFKLQFNDDQALYKPIVDKDKQENPFLNFAAGNNIVLTDIKKGTFKTKKKVFDKTYLVQDSLRNIQWRITNEIKIISGYTCRRANAIILDSVYVVAFYTDEIVPKVGPESFSGLPGMILGIALPYEHTTWFATMVIPKTQQPVDNALEGDKVDKEINSNELLQLLENIPIMEQSPDKKNLFMHRIVL